MQASRRRVAFFSAAAAAGVLTVMPQLATASLLAPDSAASDSAGSARTAYVIMAVVGLLIVLGVLAAMGRAVRSGDGSEGDSPRRTRGTSSAQLRVGIGLGALALVLFVVGIIFTGKTTEVEAATDAEPITIRADGQQWLWRYQYPSTEETADGFSADAPYSYYKLVVPVDTPIDLELTSVDVMHRWSVPALAPSADAVPGLTNDVSFTATETGTFEGASTRFSGAGYSTMRTIVEVVEPEEYETFLQERIDEIKAARAAVQERVDDGTAPGVRFAE